MGTKLRRTLLPGGILACLLLSLLYHSTYACVIMQTVPTAAPSATPSAGNPVASPTPPLPTQARNTPTRISSTLSSNTPTIQESRATQVQPSASSPSPIPPTSEGAKANDIQTPIPSNTSPAPPETPVMVSATEWLKSLYLLICGLSVIGGGVVIAIIITRQRKTQSNQK